jgi:hypothetical protein
MATDPLFTDLPNSFIRETGQVCIVTHDLDTRIKALADQLGIGPWWVRTYEPPLLTGRTYRGQPGKYRMRLALAYTGALNWEVIQPLEGPSIYHDFLEANGEGLHHVGLFVQQSNLGFEQCVEEFGRRGFQPVQEGIVNEQVRYCYVGTEDATKTSFEIIYRPPDYVRPEPDFWYPAQD